MDDTDRRNSVATEESRDPAYPSPTTGQQIEVILARQLAGYLALPVLIIDPNRVVVYYNEAAERMLGRRFDEGGPIPWSDWTRAFFITDERGDPLPVDEMPLAIALRDRRLAHTTYWTRTLDGVRRHIETTAIPLVGTTGRFLGAMAIYAEPES